MRYFIFIFILFINSFNSIAKAETDLNKLLQPQEVKQDMDQWIEFIDKTHPQLSYTVENVDAFYSDIETFKESINKPITVLDFWRKVTVFNKTLSDGHTVINLPKLKTLANQHIKNGGGLFPYRVVFNNNKLVIKSTIDNKPTELRGYEILEINGQRTENFIAPLLNRTNGDTDSFRKALLQKKMAEYIWLYYGNIDTFDLQLIKFGKSLSKNVPASEVEFNLDDVFSDNFKFEILDQENALLTINTFSWGAEYKDVVTYLHGVFEKLNNSLVTHLIIDVRENGGGDDVIWIDGILPYLSDKPWRTGSKYKVKVLEGRASKENKVGDVVEGEVSLREFNTEVTKFSGDVSVLISDFTYSSSILFANVIQDHNFGQLVGEPTGGRSGQTGGTQFLTLENSNLQVISPRFYLERPKGGQTHEPVEPDLYINYDKTIPEQLINKLVIRRSLSSGEAP
ncbi:S41 family peptidase [Alteromonas facilis]|uniref:S41 family peptidase n=1 Tax=Alteromonas facilis TaxID=2048004 RepID=UPI000C2890A4|nr:S41 family peptidase [Alteromonas facilis]